MLENVVLHKKEHDEWEIGDRRTPGMYLNNRTKILETDIYTKKNKHFIDDDLRTELIDELNR